MKKVLFAFLAAVIAFLPSIAVAGFSSGNAVLMTRLEVSKDNSTWVNYLAEENSGGQTLTVSPGDTVYFRLKTWDTGNEAAFIITYDSNFTNPSYITSTDMFSSTGAKDDLDGDALGFYSLNSFSETTGIADFGLNGIAAGSTVDTDYQSGGINAVIKSDAPDQTVILATVQITDAGREINWFKDLLFSRALADDHATTQARILVSNPPATVVTTPTLPVTGPDPIQLILSPVMRLCL